MDRVNKLERNPTAGNKKVCAMAGFGVLITFVIFKNICVGGQVATGRLRSIAKPPMPATAQTQSMVILIMRKYILVILIGFTVLACGQSNSGDKGNALSTNKNQTEGWQVLTETNYSIEYPPNWPLDQSKIGATSFILFGRSGSEGKFRENINLLIQDLSGLGFDLNKYVELSEQQIQTMVANSKLFSSKRIKTESGEFHQIIYQGEQGQFKLKWKQYYWVLNDQAYVLTFTGTQETYDDFIETADKVLNSFKIIK